MEHDERQGNYVRQRKVRVAVGEAVLPKLTPKQRRRLRQKRDVAHSHQGRLLVEVEPGKFKPVPCSRCRKLPKLRFGGGTA